MDKKDFKKKCRCCFTNMIGVSYEITSEIEAMFFELTQIELKSDIACRCDCICSSCHDELKHFLEFKSQLVNQQLEFYKFLDNNVDHSDFVLVKMETFEEVDFLALVNHADKDLVEDETHRIDEASEIISEVYECNLNSYSTKKPVRLKKYSEESHNTARRRKRTDGKVRKQCPTCGILVKNLSEHQKMVHIQMKRFLCDLCDYSAYFKTKITRHLQRHIPKHLRDQYPCESHGCNFIATRKDALKSHVLTMHQEKREKSESCKECQRMFFTKSQLNIHIKAVHERIKRHLCSSCGKSFFHVKDLEMHVKRHGVKDQACEICQAMFYCSVDLRRHLKIHSSPQIPCEITGCSKKFYTNSKLKMHIKTRHEGAKDFFCDYCSSRFSQDNNLKRHVNSVHKSLRINCLIPGCTYSVARKDKYKNHLTSQHKYLDDQTKESIMKSVKFE